MKKRIMIEGKRVHNVGYRPFLMEIAQELKIPNFHAKNVKEDGKQVVDVRVGGEEERIDNFLKFVNENRPEYAEVENISVMEHDGDIMTLKEFSRVFSALQMSKIVQTGLGMLDRQDMTIEVLGGRIDNLGENLGGKINQGFSKTNQNFSTLRDDYGKISDKMDNMNETLKKLTDAMWRSFAPTCV